MERVLEQINILLWGRVISLMLIAIGVFLTVRSGFFQIRRFPNMFSATVGKLFSKKEKKSCGNLTVWQSTSTALASTIGTGSIVGVAAALKFGGPGAVFWMWISAFLGMVIKYTEIVLAVQFRQKNRNGLFAGGPMYYLRYGLKSRVLSVIFCVFCIGVCFGMGNMVQSNAISASLFSQFRVDQFFSGIILLFFTGAVVFGGSKRIAKMNASLVPIMCLIYVSCCIIIVFSRANILPSVIRKIVVEAFSLPAAAGGISSYGIFLALKNGFSKGIFSSEAGLGSAPIAHASAESENESEHGFWGMFEVFFTTLVCTLTSLVILTSNLFETSHLSAEALTLFSFEDSLPNVGGFIVCLSTVLFSLSSILGWAFYGEICINFLAEKNKILRFLFRTCYVFAVYFGAVGSMQRIWLFSELMNAFMMIPNLIGITLLANRVFRSKPENNIH